ncbi:3-oxoadipate CoA-transferase subunit A [Acetobacter indonesiensis NRIC 0313]|uniref:3-oxoacid CoA-transferase subunit A n=1 Tax=Acetobacter indonesiensis TaxID=104101 RepID=A0A252ALG5_9PROT|nr:3-oxoacid CoA-transferase subunit A [Acetobacter indonesiensis]OUI90541.1 3-oxoadipate CoA-transferase [Acetobacter indonesiensis]GAN64494.1 3-oxoacid CoA-transferase subunit A [Acetobacter indonesiensis]GBQ55292.1 3-oxoadipate CoA-transferase subunit A [Acetobacter indonesiensis NRIC 0313]GEN04207.1 3-oxoadipate CoA-transferase subunit A [Acetobacter indonesiensis]
MINKQVRSVADALEGIRDGSVVMIGGFGSVGQPDAIIEGLIEQGARNLTLIANNAGSGHVGLAKLLNAGRVSRIICSYPRSSGSVVFEALFQAGKLDLEIVPQGTLAERIRAAGAGIPAFYTPTTVGTILAKGKEHREFNGRTYVLEEALPADVALVEAWTADQFGNCVYRESGRNFNAIMATAAKLTIVQACNMTEAGTLDPEAIVTPGLFVQRIVHVPERTLLTDSSASAETRKQAA